MYVTFFLVFVLSVVSCETSVENWPLGTYGLIEAASGCPDGDLEWQYGTRMFDTEDTDSHNIFSPGIETFLAGQFAINDIAVQFCIKDNSTDDEPPWQHGTYCILKKGDCPSGFHEGSIYWDDDDWLNHNSATGVLPDGTYTSNTLIYFCCRFDGPQSTGIDLPTAHPFILLRYGSFCQTVNGMNVTETFVRWDDEDKVNSDSASGSHPFDDGGSKDHRLHFCHYQKYPGQSPIVG